LSEVIYGCVVDGINLRKGKKTFAFDQNSNDWYRVKKLIAVPKVF